MLIIKNRDIGNNKSFVDLKWFISHTLLRNNFYGIKKTHSTSNEVERLLLL